MPQHETLQQYEAQLSLLAEEDQLHLLDGWDYTEAGLAGREAFFAQLGMLEAGYPGGVRAYLGKARELLKASEAGDNPGCVGLVSTKGAVVAPSPWPACCRFL